MTIGTPTHINQGDTQDRNSGSASNGTSASAPGGSLIVTSLFANGSGATILTLIDSVGNTYQNANRIAVGTSGSLELWSCPNIISLGSGGTFTATTSGGGTWYLNGGSYVTGANGGLDKTNNTSVSSTSFSMPTGILSAGSEVIFGAATTPGTLSTYTEDANYTEQIGSPVSNFSGGDLAARVVSSNASTNWGPSWTPSNTFYAILATFMASDYSGGAMRIYRVQQPTWRWRRMPHRGRGFHGPELSRRPSLLIPRRTLLKAA